MEFATSASASSLDWMNRPTHALLRLAWPIAVSTVSWTVMQLVGTLFMAHVGADQLAGVGLAGIVLWTFMCFTVGMLRSTKTLVSQAVGAGRPHDTDGYLAAGLAFGVGMGALALALSQLAAPVLAMATSDPDVGRFAAQSIRIRAFAAPIALAFIALRETRWGEGESRTPMRASVSGNVVNIALDTLLILGLGWGVVGAAVASIAGASVELAMLAWPMRARLARLVWNRAHARAVWQQGVPTGLQFLMEVGSFLLLSAFIARMTSVDGAAHQIVLQLTHVSFLPAHAIAEASSVMVGQAVGAGRDVWVRRVAWRALAVSGAYAAVCTAVLGGGATVVAGWFADEPALHRLTVTLLHVSLAFLVADAANVVARGVLRGAGDVRYPAVMGVITAWAMTPPITWLLGLHLGWGVVGGWVGLSAEIFLGAALFWWRVARGHWRAAAAESRRLVGADGVRTPDRDAEFDEDSLSSNTLETAA